MNTTEENYISLEQASKICRLKDPRFRTIEKLFEEGLVKYQQAGFVMFSETELAKHVGVKNLEEPFLFLDEAAAFLKVPKSAITSLVKKALLPSYSLRSTKISKLLFLKSELEHARQSFNNATIVKEGRFWDQEIRMEMFQRLFSGMTRWMENDLEINPRDVAIAQAYMCNNESIEAIAERFNLTKERCRQINEKVYRKFVKINKIAERFNSNRQKLILENRQMQGKIMRLERELSERITNSVSTSIPDDAKDAFLATPIKELGLPTQCYNVLKYSDIKTFGEILNHSIMVLLGFKNFGRTSAIHLIKMAHQHGYKMKDEEFLRF